MPRLLVLFALSAVTACGKRPLPDPPPETCPTPPGVVIFGEATPSGIPEPWKFRMTVAHIPRPLPPRAIPVAMTVVPRGTTRAVSAESVLEGFDSTSFTGFLAEEPPDGACVRLGYIEGPLPVVGRYRRGAL